MANDRMWLMHRPTQKMCLLAKNCGDDRWDHWSGPYTEPFYSPWDLLAECGYSTDYCIVYESEGW